MDERIVMIATTNLYDYFDKALIRRFDSVIDDNIIFTLIGIKKNVAIKKDFYNSLLDRSKFKEPRKAIVLDRDNFWKYHKMK